MNQPAGGYVLRLVVVKLEGVIVPPVETWIDQILDESGSPEGIRSEDLFSEWVDQVDVTEEFLRDQLSRWSEMTDFRPDPDLLSFLDYVRNHTPVRVGFLSVGPKEWVQSVENEFDLQSYRDLTFHFDHYSHGERRTLLQFLMNRFIAGKGRTLFLGNHPDDERIANREDARFRSLESPAEDGSVMDPENWNYSLEDLRDLVNDLQPEE